MLQAVVASCDDALSELAGFQCECSTYLKVRMWAQASTDSDHHHDVKTGCQQTLKALNQVCPLQELPKEIFLKILDGAVRFDMPKLLACCEHCIAVDDSD